MPDPQPLAIRAVLNGETMQESSTANMVFGVADLIAYITQTITLEPGDLIATGTPAGVGAFPQAARVHAAGRRDHDRDRGARLADEPGHVRVVRGRSGLLAGLFLAGLALRPQIVGIGPLIPSIQDDLDVSHSVAGLLGTIPVLCMGSAPSRHRL